VSTVKGFEDSCDSWVRHHLRTGFSRLYLFFDDVHEFERLTPRLGALLAAEGFASDRVHAVSSGPELRRSWEELDGADEWLPFVDTEVQARQALNCLVAVGLAVEAGLAWLLHLDADELFHAPGRADGDVRPHFASLSEQGVHCLTYPNLEAVPEADPPPRTCPFLSVSLFKRNPRMLHTDAPEARAALAFWRRRHASLCGAEGGDGGDGGEGGEGGDGGDGGCIEEGGDSSSEPRLFFYYTNGKSSVRLCPRARPLSVHEWVPGCAAGLSHWFSYLGGHDLVQRRAANEASPVVLHFPACSSDALWRRWRGGDSRYVLRGQRVAPPIYDALCGTAAPGGLGAMTQAADVGDESGESGGENEDGGAAAVSGRRDDVRRLFESTVALFDAGEARSQIDAGVCVRISAPMQRLAAAAGQG